MTAVGQMKRVFDLIQSQGLDIEDFYHVDFDKNSLSLNGYQTISNLEKYKDLKYSGYFPNYLCKEWKVEDVLIEINFTPIPT